MNMRTYMGQLLTILLTACVALLPHTARGSAPITPSLLYGEYKPAQLIGIGDPAVDIAGAAWRGAVDTALFSATSAATPMVALTAPDSRIEVTCATAATTVGVQFLGDQNDGWAKIFVDGESRWQGSTQGDMLVNDDYIEISDLAMESHLIRVETMITPGTAQLGHVTVVAFGCGSLSTVGDTNSGAAQRTLSADEQRAPGQTVYLPTIMS